MSDHDQLCLDHQAAEKPRTCVCRVVDLAEHRGRARELKRIVTEIDAIKTKVAFGSKAGYRQGFVACWHLIREAAARGQSG